MPSIIIEISEADHKGLRDEYERVAATWPKPLANAAVPRFEQWAGSRLVGMQEPATNDMTAELHQAYQRLLERTVTALDHLGEERAIGRAEGAIAILVSLQVMERETAQKKTIAFKAKIRNAKSSAKKVGK